MQVADMTSENDMFAGPDAVFVYAPSTPASTPTSNLQTFVTYFHIRVRQV